jgi:AdoMet-dependent heme synthase
MGERVPYVFSEAPRRIYWEITRACDLACRHCRARAMPEPGPGELSFEEATRVIDSLAEASPRPHLILTGGDPLKRPDFWDLFDHARERGLSVSVSPSATASVTDEALERLVDGGVSAMSVSLDGSTAELHDGMRGVPGCFADTLRIARRIVERGIPLQVNTLATKQSHADLPSIAELVGEIGAKRWSLFFLVRTGRGEALESMEPEQAEEVFRWLAEIDGQRFVASTTEAPQYRRVALQGGHRAMGLGMRDGNGVMFIGHDGAVTPSGFLPLPVGNVRETDPMELYRTAPLMQRLRDVSQLRGRCGRCEYRSLCGGSRARAYCDTGDAFGEDPLCAYSSPATGSPGLHGSRTMAGAPSRTEASPTPRRRRRA